MLSSQDAQLRSIAHIIDMSAVKRYYCFYMNKKLIPVKISTKKILLISTIIIAVGIFVLVLSILLRSPKTEKPPVVTELEVPIVVDKPSKETVEPVLPPPVPSIPEKPDPKPQIETPSKPVIEKPVAPPVIEKTKDGVLVFIFDDGGHKLSHTELFTSLPFPITVAVLPQLADSVESAALVRNTGNEVFLHQPMQAQNLAIDPGPGAILPEMTTGEASQVLRQNLLEIGPVSGVNNHEGSLITSDRNLMSAVIDVCLDNNILFLDSRTTAQTAVPAVALEKDIDILQRDIFLDNEKNTEYMRLQVEKGLEIADKKGYVIMIGHVTTPNLAPLLDEMYDNLVAMGYTFTTPSKLQF